MDIPSDIAQRIAYLAIKDYWAELTSEERTELYENALWLGREEFEKKQAPAPGEGGAK